MSVERLVGMANEIATFFAGAESADEAPRAAAAHLQRFWSPAMRRQLVDYLRRDGSALTPVAAKAAAALADGDTFH
jgi:formate dehydrogenase subunit delta